MHNGPTADADDTADHDTVIVGAGFTNNLTVDFDIDTLAPNSVVATNYTKSLTITAADTDLDGDADAHVATITGGTGSDTIQITANGGTIEQADMAEVSNVEKIEILLTPLHPPASPSTMQTLLVTATETLTVVFAMSSALPWCRC